MLCLGKVVITSSKSTAKEFYTGPFFVFLYLSHIAPYLFITKQKDQKMADDDEKKELQNNIENKPKTNFVDLSESPPPPQSKSKPSRKISNYKLKPQSYNCFDKNCSGTMIWKNKSHFTSVKGVMCDHCNISVEYINFAICTSPQHSIVMCTSCFLNEIRKLNK